MRCREFSQSLKDQFENTADGQPAASATHRHCRYLSIN
ncbi:Uncharacterized protein YR821_1159 [Yersinia ruckeri]|uniref:Uncharacterized protein n=1 Tax=Yersinia ruckeri TaxID=29486 RepID=A0A0A8VBP2_YERRU|nr:hypothetical protein yruck0001_18760 [Yersinia ruckeri ATCC 29473]QTD76090.1 Uncharacterized protein YR821_1159 [Yersinia ruckeri]CEK26990.1 hypothetical protein CSF007_6165 [Yersinia ruckeri]